MEERRENGLMPECWNAKYAEYFYSYAYAKVNDSELARDLVQETFLAGLENMDRFSSLSSERTWLAAILNHKIFRIYRHRASNIFVLSASPELYENELFVTPEMKRFLGQVVTPSDRIERCQLFSFVEQALTELPETWRSVFRMRFCDGRSANDICEALQLTPSNYWVICHRLKAALRRKMGSAGL